MKAKSYGNVAITHIHGVSCDCDDAHFDGWYRYHRHAVQIFELFKKRYPEADVFIVERKQAEWRMINAIASDGLLKQIRDDHTARREATGT